MRKVLLALTFDELASLRYLANSVCIKGPLGIPAWVCEKDRVQALRDVLDREGWTTERVLEEERIRR